MMDTDSRQQEILDILTKIEQRVEEMISVNEKLVDICRTALSLDDIQIKDDALAAVVTVLTPRTPQPKTADASDKNHDPGLPGSEGRGR